MHPVKTAHHKAVHHVDNRLGHGIVDALIGQHALLDDHLGECQPLLGLDVLQVQVFDVAHRHDAHAAIAVVCFDDDKWLFVDTVLFVLATDFGQQRIHVAAQAVHAHAGCKVHFTTLGVQRVDQPRVHAQQLAKALGHLLISLKVARLAAYRPGGVQRRQ